MRDEPLADPYEIDPEEIEEFCDVVGGTVWHCDPVDPDRIKARAASGDTIATPWQVMSTPGHELPDDFDPVSWHEGRVAHLILNPQSDPIEIEFADFGSGPEPMIVDGAHRLLAAIISGAERVAVTFAQDQEEEALEVFPEMTRQATPGVEP